MLGQTFLKTVTFIGLWSNETVCLLRSVRHVVLTSLARVIKFNEFIVIFYNFYDVICFLYEVTQFFYKLSLQFSLLFFSIFVNMPLNCNKKFVKR